ncbi:MAG: UDP-N-acetylglucosamine 1-carboxyvinyltransferase [Clostridia bacterium]|nr:UDP-N-acetylglucosamine 1-carboxyvinyltransferase [Clostridia bacterium]
MRAYKINGGKKLEGTISAQSSKNSVLSMLAGAILTDDTVVIKNCPKISDVINMCKILSSLGASVEFDDNDLIINASQVNSFCVDEKLCKKIRTSIYFLGSLLGRFGRAKLCFPGGCNIGARPIDIHIKALSELGVKFDYNEKNISCSKQKTVGDREVVFSFPSVGATINLLLFSVINEGTLVIKNCAREPEVVDFCNFLNSMGAKIVGAGQSEITVYGVKQLHGTKYRPISDRMEIGTFIFATYCCGGKVNITNVNLKNSDLLLDKISNNTCSVAYINDIITITSNNIGEGFDVQTGPFPQFPTDLQAQATVYLSICNGRSIVIESMYENRFSHLNGLKQMGADVHVFKNVAFIQGVKRLQGAKVFANDLRGGAALTIAGLCARGQTLMCGVEHVERGYLDYDKKLAMLGASIKTIDL